MQFTAYLATLMSYLGVHDHKIRQALTSQIVEMLVEYMLKVVLEGLDCSVTE